MTKSKMYIRLIKGAVMKRKSRMLISLLAIALGAAVVSALVSVYYDMGVKMRRELRTYGANVAISPAGGQQHINETALTKLMGTLPEEKLLGYTPYLYGVIWAKEERLVAAGTDFKQVKQVSPYWQVDGQWPKAEQLLVGVTAAKKLNVNIGDQIMLKVENQGTAKMMAVSGIVKTGGAEDAQVFMSLNQAQLLFAQPGKVNVAFASVLDSGGWVQEWAANNTGSGGTQVSTIKKISQAEGNILERIRSLVYLVVVIILGSTLLCVATTAMAMIMERRQEIALKKALGAENKSVIKEFLGESAALGLVGGLLGWLVGLVLAQGIGYSVFGTGVTVRWQVVPVVLATAVLLSCLAGLLPINKALSVQPAVTLKGE